MVTAKLRACVVVPTFRRPLLLKRCLESILTQTAEANEIKIVASDPDEKETIESIVEEVGLSRAEVVCAGRKLLGGEARNLGWKLCESEIVMFVDDDDYWDQHKIALHLSKHQETTADVVYSGVTYTFHSPQESFIQKAIPAPSDVKSALTGDGFCPPTTSCVSVCRSALEHVSGFDDRLLSYQDWDLWYRLADTCKFASIAEPLTYFVQHSGERVSMQSDKRSAAATQLLEKHGRSKPMLDFLSREYVRTVERSLVFAARNGDFRCIANYWSEARSGSLSFINWRTYWILLKMVVYLPNRQLLKRAPRHGGASNT
ncbi:glycosyltransferase involved in cell wall biosynthesis [Bradyrhizobium sp. GM2.2]|uniref:glycosyltransferase family 2 protein n=1 Tax=Bradyrhizobium sp. GM2.2 TaxID=3156358 RepID=UPI0033942F09